MADGTEDSITFVNSVTIPTIALDADEMLVCYVALITTPTDAANITATFGGMTIGSGSFLANSQGLLRFYFAPGFSETSNLVITSDAGVAVLMALAFKVKKLAGNVQDQDSNASGFGTTGSSGNITTTTAKEFVSGTLSWVGLLVDATRAGSWPGVVGGQFVEFSGISGYKLALRNYYQITSAIVTQSVDWASTGLPYNWIADITSWE